MNMEKTILEAKNIVKTFEGDEERPPLTVLDGTSLTVAKGSVSTVVGASGCGKSTLLHILGGLDRPNEGTVYWEGSEIYAMDKEALAGFRNKKRSEEHTSELQSRFDLVCRLLL